MHKNTLMIRMRPPFCVDTSKFTMRAVLLLTVVALAFANEECGENEHFESCGTACPLTCDNYRNPPKVCVLRCDIGCHCDKGYVRNADGRCVRPEQCPSSAPKECGENEHFESCGTACPLTCDNYQNPPKVCVLRCDIGCHCDKGYVRAADGRCVRPEQCPSSAPIECGENAHFERCGTPCPLTCENYQNPPKFCVKSCYIGCQCEKGYVKTADGQCVRPEQCLSSGPEPDEKNCVDERDSGRCFAFFPMYYYDVSTQKCRRFIYGGCGGNGNRYKTKEECKQNCEVNAASSSCLQEKKVGFCKALIPRFYFNQETGQCEEFFYGGCGGNDNNFSSQEDCEAECKA